MRVTEANKVTSRAGRLSLTAVLVFTSSIATASPTVSRRSAAVNVNRGSEDPTTTMYIRSDAATTTEVGLSHLARELLQPPAAAAGPSSTAKSLPAVPGALLMVVTGFACVSLVRDRRFWLAAVAGILGLGQAGLAALPELASNLKTKGQIEQPCSLHGSRPDDSGDFRVRADLEGTQYIGLLRHLGGMPPEPRPFSMPAPLVSKPAGRSVTTLAAGPLSAQNRATHDAPQSAIVNPFAKLDPTSTCSAYSAGRLVCFSQVFAIQYLGRGPPGPPSRPSNPASSEGSIARKALRDGGFNIIIL